MQPHVRQLAAQACIAADAIATAAGTIVVGRLVAAR